MKFFTNFGARARANSAVGCAVVLQKNNAAWTKEMTNPSNDQTNKAAGAARGAANETAHVGRAVTDEAARVGEQSARAGADFAHRGVQTARDNPQAGLDTAAQSFQRMTGFCKHSRQQV